MENGNSRRRNRRHRSSPFGSRLVDDSNRSDCLSVLHPAGEPRRVNRGRKGCAKAQLYKRAKAQHIEGRSRMSKRQLENALHSVH
jgi:hypothetical protein